MNTTEISTKKPNLNKPYKFEEFPKMLFREGDSRTANNPEEEAEAIKHGWSETPPIPISMMDRRADNVSTLSGAIVSYESVKRELDDKTKAFGEHSRRLTTEIDELKRLVTQLEAERDSLARENDIIGSANREHLGTIEKLKSETNAKQEKPKKPEAPKPAESQ